MVSGRGASPGEVLVVVLVVLVVAFFLIVSVVALPLLLLLPRKPPPGPQKPPPEPPKTKQNEQHKAKQNEKHRLGRALNFHNIHLLTPYSMNSLFSEFFKKFSGVILGVCDTIWRLFGGHLGGVL